MKNIVFYGVTLLCVSHFVYTKFNDMYNNRVRRDVESRLVDYQREAFVKGCILGNEHTLQDFNLDTSKAEGYKEVFKMFCEIRSMTIYKGY